MLDKTQEPILTTHLQLGSANGLASRRYKMRMLTKEIGRPLEGVCGLREFLCVMYDACAVQRNLYRKCKILHRDISDGNIMFAPDTDEYRKRCAEGHAEVRFVNQVLAKDKDSKPAPTCLVIGLGNGADLKVERGREALRERTGTPKFIARSVSIGELLNEEDYESHAVDMPPMEGPLGDYAGFMHDTEHRVLDGRSSSTDSEVLFAHRLFHDAESTFWVIAWTLTRSVRQRKGPQPKEKPHWRFGKFFHTMYRHHPIPGGDDSRLALCEKNEGYWKLVLHPDLAIVARMLGQMYKYIRPEWAHRPELDAEHVHEALMRLLLAEIVRIDTNDQDIPIVVGGRAVPPPPDGMSPLPSGTRSSLSNNVSYSHSWNSADSV